MAHDVFVCHPTEQKHVADAIVARLESAGIRCWIAPRDIVPGADFLASIVAAISAAKVLVVVFSADANASPHVMREVKQAVEMGVPVLPFRIEAVEPSPQLGYLIGPSHWLDALTPPLEAHIARLATVVQGILEEPLEAGEGVPGVVRSARGTVPPVRRRRRRWLWVLAGAVLAVPVGVFVVNVVAGILEEQELGPQVDVSEATVAELVGTGLEQPGRQVIVGAFREPRRGSPFVIAVGADFSQDPDGDAAIWISEDDGETWESLDFGLAGKPGAQVLTGVTIGPLGMIAVGYEQDAAGRGPVVWRLEGEPVGGFYRPSHWQVLWEDKNEDQNLTVMLDMTQGPYGLTAVGWDYVRGPAAWHSVDGTEWDRAEGYLPGGQGTWMNSVGQFDYGDEPGVLATGGSDNPWVWTSAYGGLTWERENLDIGFDRWANFNAFVTAPIGHDQLDAVLFTGAGDDTPMVWIAGSWGIREHREAWRAIPVAAEGSFDTLQQAELDHDPLKILWGPFSDRGTIYGTVVHCAVSAFGTDGTGRVLLFGQKPGEDGEPDAAVWTVTFDEATAGG